MAQAIWWPHFGRGYDVLGVDYERSVVEYLNREFPGLQIAEGNILGLNLPDGAIRGYVSIGVVEHFEKGPVNALKEAKRVFYPRTASLSFLFLI